MSKIKEILDREVDNIDDLFHGVADYFDECKKQSIFANEKTWLDDFIEAYKTQTKADA